MGTRRTVQPDSPPRYVYRMRKRGSVRKDQCSDGDMIFPGSGYTHSGYSLQGTLSHHQAKMLRQDQTTLLNQKNHKKAINTAITVSHKPMW